MKSIIISLGILLATLAAFWGSYQSPREPAFGGVSVGHEYNATTTGGQLSGMQAKEALIKNAQGTLGSVVVSGANTGIINLYNATTSNINLRTGQKATSTILLASFPASVAAGTYVYDAQFDNLLYVGTGLVPTTTIMWR
jgi:hypothetical protein